MPCVRYVLLPVPKDTYDDGVLLNVMLALVRSTKPPLLGTLVKPDPSPTNAGAVTLPPVNVNPVADKYSISAVLVLSNKCPTSSLFAFAPEAFITIVLLIPFVREYPAP